MSQDNICEQLYISNLVYRYGPTKYKGRQYIKPIYSDEEWDALVEQHKTEYEQFLNTVPTNISLLPQIEHPIICGSLQKYTSKTYDTFLNRIRKLKILDNDKGFILTPKYDGCSMRMYFYPNGNILCMNRNECDYGVNLTFRCSNILKYIDTDYIANLIQKHNLACVAIRGEIIIPQKRFQDQYAQTYASVQNATTAQITCMKEPINSDFVIYEFLPIKLLQRGEEIVDINLIQTYLHQLAFAKKSILQSNQEQRVSVSSFKKCEYKDITDENLFKTFYDEHNNKPYPCDGVVIRLNTYQKALFENKQKPLYQVAYKFEQNNHQTIPVQLEWSVNSQYELIPTLVVEPVKIGPKTITRIAMSNLNKCLEYDIFNKIQQKKQVSVCLAGQIIPQLSKVEQVFSLEMKKQDIQQQCYQILNDPRNKPICCPLCQSEAIKLICTTSTKGNTKIIHYKYICSERKCRNKIISTKFLKHFKPYLKTVKINGKQSIGEATLNRLIIENNNNLDSTIVQILNSIQNNLNANPIGNQPNQIDKTIFYLTFCDNETETSIRQKIDSNQEQTLIDSMFFNLSARNMNLPLISQFIQKNTSFKNIASNQPTMVRISSQLKIDTSKLPSELNADLNADSNADSNAESNADSNAESNAESSSESSSQSDI